MARIATLITVLSLIVSGFGCSSMNNYPAASSPPAVISAVDLSTMNEIDLAEKVAMTRQEYKRSLQMLRDYYAGSGNNRKLSWSQKELSSLERIPDYTYVEDTIPGPELKGTMAIPAATAIYMDAEQIQRQSGLILPGGVTMPYIRNDNQLRLALDKYVSLIRQYPSSDKIDDAAFQAGYINEHLGNYDIALTFYQRAYQWDSRTPNPARFRAAYLLDNRLRHKDEAVDLYQEAITAEGVRFPQWEKYAQDRIKALTNTGDSVD